MVVLKHEILIESAPEKVWGILADLEAVKYYNPTVLNAKCISPNREGIGAGRECDVKPKGKVKERVTGWIPGKSLAMELYESDWPVRNMAWTTLLEPSNGGTKVSQTLQYEPKGLLGAVLNTLMMKRLMDKNISRVFAGLKEFAEKPSREVPSKSSLG